MSGTSKTSYAKPWLSLADQVAKLESRGLAVANKEAAEDFLRHVNYYRFSGYCLAFRSTRHQFLSGVTFEDIESSYYFDCRLRDLCNDALEWLEVDIRTAVAYHFGKKYGGFGHVNSASFHPQFDTRIVHQEWLEKLRGETRQTKALFVEHFKAKYLEYPDLPVWVVTETMTFGSLSRMIRGMLKVDREQIGRQYGVNAQEFGSIVFHLSYVRNLCAHHARLWDKIWSIPPNVPKGSEWRSPNGPVNNRVMCTILLMSLLLKMNRACKNLTDQWRVEIKQHVSMLPNTANASVLVGQFNNWESHPAW